MVNTYITALLDTNIVKLVDFMHAESKQCLGNEWLIMVVITTTIWRCLINV